MDLRTYRVPNSFIVLCSITGMYLLWLEMGMWGTITFLYRFLWPIALLYIIYLIGGLGAGDIKLLAVVSTAMTSQNMMWLIMCSLCIGAAYGLFRLIKSRQLCLFYMRKSANYHTTKIHFTVCILFAFVGCLCKEGII